MKLFKKKSVFVAMSGGVDSSVATLLLKKEGYSATGVFMRCYNLDGCAERDAEDARRVAEKIGIPFYVWDFEEDYKKLVVDYMVQGYRTGITPNPDVMCNKEIKFGMFFKRALALGADYVATGHYIRLERDLKIGNCKLKIAKDTKKDQSYFLWTLAQEQLRQCLFPIGAYLKSGVREIAKKAGLPTAEKKDSQGICFLGKISVEDFLKQYIPERRGELLNVAGGKIGEHAGAEFCTIGQRHINADFVFPKTGKNAERRPFYVAAKNVESNTVVLAEGSENPSLYKKELRLEDINFTSRAPVTGVYLPVLVRVRYRQPLAKAVLREATLVFEEPQKFVAAGQSAVFYSEDGEMLGGGVIAA